MSFIERFLYRPVYFCFGAVAGIAGAAVEVVGCPLTMLTTSGGIGLSAFASKMETCHICVSVNTLLKEGMPVKRIPFDTFQ